MPAEPEFPLNYHIAQFEEANGPLNYREFPLEYPKHGELLVKVLACGVCHTDVTVGKGILNNDFPIVPGHEIIGDVVSLGPGVKSHKIGERVGGLFHGGHCGTCKGCNRGVFQLCERQELNGVTRPGGYGEYCILRIEAVARLPKDIDPAELAPMLCAGVTTFNGIRKRDIPAGELVAIQGLGGLGHLAVQFANKMGYKTVAISGSGMKEQFAHELGAHYYVDSSAKDTVSTLQELGGAALAVLTAPNPEYIEPLLKSLAPRGKLLLLAPVGQFTADSTPLVRNENSIVGMLTGHALDAEEVVDFARTHDIKCLIDRYKLADANKAIDDMLHGRVRFRAVLTMD